MSQKDIQSIKIKNSTLIASFVVLILLIYGYKDHFNNPFHFDDDHTICSNQFIRDLSNFPKFWTDASTFSSLPANQAYRPGITTLNAIDYWVGERFGEAKQAEPLYFHIHIFISYLVLGVLIYFMILKIFSLSLPHRWNPFFALFATAFFMLHTANVETITYIISRSDTGSTLMLVLAMVMYLYKPLWRKYYLYAIPVFFGFFVKEPAIMFAPILFIYVLLYEEKISFPSVFDGSKIQPALKALLKTLPLFILAVVLFSWAMHKTPETWTSGAGTGFTDRMKYLQTQAFVVVHYFNNFLLPLNLSADTDWKIIPTFFDDRIMVGVLFIAALITIAFLSSKQEKTRPIAFGVAWFFIALVPTSSIFPFAEVLNDHRTFFPYIGLSIASIWALALLVMKYEKQIVSNRLLTFSIVLLAFSILVGHTIGARTRVEVWSSGEKLWHDVTIKSPGNGRGWMNYGNALMSKNDLLGARECYTKAKALYPYYSYIYLNLGVLDAREGKHREAEANYKYALQLDPRNPESYFWYSNWLRTQNRKEEAANLIQQGLKLSPNHAGLKQQQLLLNMPGLLDMAIIKAKQNPSSENYLDLSLQFYNVGKYDLSIKAAQEALKLKPDYDLAYDNIGAAYAAIKDWNKAIEAIRSSIKIHPTPEKWINLSLHYYNSADYLQCVKASEEALKLKPDYDLAYNNICAAYNALKDWDKAIEAADKGLQINPNNQLLKNNRMVAVTAKNAK